MLKENFRYTVAPLLWNGLSVTLAGTTVFSPGHAVPRRLYGHYSLHFIRSGSGRYHVGGVTYPVGAGEGFLITPDQPCCYTADSERDWIHTYIVFTGPDPVPFLQELGLLSSPVFSFSPDYLFYDLLNAVLIEAEKPDFSNLIINGLFLELLGALSRCIPHVRPADEPEKYVTQAISFIEDNYTEDISVQEVADKIGINRSYLHRLFVRSRGVSPSRFLLNLRLDRARDMMMHREFSLTEIAMAVGFCDAAHFSKSFTARFGISPRACRKELLGQEQAVFPSEPRQ